MPAHHRAGLIWISIISQAAAESDAIMRRLSPEFAADILNALSAHIAVLDADGTIIAVNDAWREFAQANGSADSRSYVGANYLAICEAASRKGADRYATAVLHGLRDVMGGKSIEFTIEYPCHSPEKRRWFIVHVTSCRHDSAASLIVSHEDITARKLAEEEAERARQAAEEATRRLQQALAREQDNARTDELTGVGNRRHLFSMAEQQLGLARRYKRNLAVALLDIDHFKRINDTYGHQIGDLALQHVARVAREELREVDVLARYGGEEFAMLLPDSDAQQAAVVAERIRLRCATQGVETPQGHIGLTVSIGVADVLSQDAGIEASIRRADQALYQAKGTGRDRVMVFAPS